VRSSWLPLVRSSWLVLVARAAARGSRPSGARVGDGVAARSPPGGVYPGAGDGDCYPTPTRPEHPCYLSRAAAGGYVASVEILKNKRGQRVKDSEAGR
jgi:hypothetical protein